MIIQELCRYYDRLSDNPEISISPPGFSREKIHAEIVLDREGNLIQFNDLRIQKGKKLVPREMIVPESCKRPGQKSYEKPFFLWDNTKFVLGADIDNDSKINLKLKYFKYSKELHRKLYEDTSDDNLKILLLFLDKWDPQNTETLNNWKELAGGNIVFRLDGERSYFHEKKILRNIWIKYNGSSSQESKGHCLVSGLYQSIARIHPAIKNVKGAKSNGAIVSFNDPSYESYGKKQNYNAPVGEMAAFSYTTSLNYLLANDGKQKIQIGDATTVFWTERESPIEGMFGMILDPKESEVSDNDELHQILEAVRDGKLIDDIDPDVKFFILGLSPNAARIAVRFWHVCTVGQLAENIGQHFRDLKIQKGDFDPEYPGIWRLLRETVNKKASDKSPSPLLAGALMRSILEGTAYPQALQNAVINRIRADQDINYIRVSILKSILNRKQRLFKQGMEVSMALNTENKKPAYLLGRLFAVLEKAQIDALGAGINATIKDRFFGSASATPKVVFPQLLRLAQHHIAKAEYGKNRDKQIEEIVCELNGFPSHLSLDEQGLFAIGYYHQRQDFFKSKESRKDN